MDSQLSRRALLGAVGGVAGSVGLGALSSASDTSADRRGVPRNVAEAERSGAVRETPTATDTPDETATSTESTSEPFQRSRSVLMPGTKHATPLVVVDAPRRGPTTFVVGGIHGDERSGFRAARRLVDYSIERGRLVVLPVANRVAVKADERHGEHGDLNRKFPPTEEREPTTPLARAIWEAVVEYDPDWVVDLHSSYGIYGSDIGGVGQAIFPTTVSPASRYASDLVGDVNEEFDLSGTMRYHVGNLLNGDRPMLVHRVGAVLGKPGYIIETTERASLSKQVEWHEYAVTRLLEKQGQLSVA